MRWMPLIALALLLSGGGAFAQTQGNPQTPPKRVKTPTSLPSPKAEPENDQAYAAPAPHQLEGPSDADVGPVQRHFVRASTTDNLDPDDPNVMARFDNGALKIREKVALDKRISVPLIHDVQNDGPQTGGSNRAMQGEIDYINWGAVTGEQIAARRGHYFTITWKNGGPKGDFLTRFEYREVKSKEVIRILTQPVHNASGATRAYFAVTDKAYLAYGPVVSWRFTVLRGDTVVAEAKSFIW